jgi:hypothetical protein
LQNRNLKADSLSKKILILDSALEKLKRHATDEILQMVTSTIETLISLFNGYDDPNKSSFLLHVSSSSLLKNMATSLSFEHQSFFANDLILTFLLLCCEFEDSAKLLALYDASAVRYILEQIYTALYQKVNSDESIMILVTKGLKLITLCLNAVKSLRSVKESYGWYLILI